MSYQESKLLFMAPIKHYCTSRPVDGPLHVQTNRFNFKIDHRQRKGARSAFTGVILGVEITEERFPFHV